ncbi:hypothetical protein M0805_008290 [Coniferiporia weirii]|nr:hypothetical protein M0805_008290 [Coniferiporia weirii]
MSKAFSTPYRPGPKSMGLFDMLADVNEATQVDTAPGSEALVAEAVAQELNYWESIVFSFDMDRDSGGSSSSGRETRDKEAKDRDSQEGPLPPSSSNATASGSGSNQPNPLQRLPFNNTTGTPFHFDPSGGFSQPPNPQMNQFGGLDPYTLAHLAALSALSAPALNAQNPANSPPNHADPFALIRHMQGLLYPYGVAGPGNTGNPPGAPHGFPSASSTSSSSRPIGNRQHAEMVAPFNAAGQQWPPQLPSLGQRHPSRAPADPSMANQLPRLSSLMLPGVSPSSSQLQTPGGGPSSASTSRHSSTDTSPSPTTPLSPSTSRAQQALDDPNMAEDKRRRNTLASARFRIKKKHKTLALERSVIELETRAEDLDREATELRRENGWLKEMLIMKGRSLRATAATADVDDEDEDESSDDEDKEAGNRDARPDVSGASSGKGKGKGKAT